MKKKRAQTPAVRAIHAKLSAADKFKSLVPALIAKGVVTFDVDSIASLSTDWTKIKGGIALAAAFPKNTEEVAQLLRACHESDIPVVPSGGRTGLAGGAVSSTGCLLLSLSKMNFLNPVDSLARTVRVGAGAVTESVHEHCAREGLMWPIDLASKGSCTVGGNLSTNAGGVRVVRYGMARRWVTGARVVTMQGEVFDLCEGLEKDNVGYNLLQLILGSEGTLALITEATLKLTTTPDPLKKCVFLFALKSLSQVFELYRSVREQPMDIGAFEFFSDPCLRAVEAMAGKKLPLSLRGQFYILMEVQSENDGIDWLAEVLGKGIIQDGTRAENATQARSLWELRENITESLSRTAMLRKFDLSLPFHRQAEFLERMESFVREEGLNLNLYFFGHFGDGSPHINVLKPDSTTEARFLKDFETFEKELVDVLLEFKGSLSAEHGVGLLRREWLTRIRTDGELALYRSIKQAFDPKGLLNPGKVL